MAVKKSVYVLPNSSETREDFEWIRSEIVAQGGEALVFEAQATDDLSSAEIRAALEGARQSDWLELTEKCREVLEVHQAPEPLPEESVAELRRDLKSLRSRAAQIDKIDHLRVSGRKHAMAALKHLERLVTPSSDAAESSTRRRVEDYKSRVWLTRPRPGVDRMASAWLIRRFIDPEARFRFGEKIPQREDVVPFDMFGVELGHRGEQVTFETLMHDFGLSDPALERIARIVHELDLRAEEITDAEGPTLDRLIEGLRASVDRDELLLDHGIAIFEALYASFSSFSNAE